MQRKENSSTNRVSRAKKENRVRREHIDAHRRGFIARHRNLPKAQSRAVEIDDSPEAAPTIEPIPINIEGE